jgi:septum formation protein
MLKKKLETYKIVLASASPRRKQLLSEMGLEFEIEIRHVVESFSKTNPEEIVIELSRKKAAAFDKKFFENSDNKLLITADTIVTLEGEILGKPENKKTAIKMLKKLSGKKHEVITGVTIKTKNKEVNFISITYVFFKHLSSEEIEFYVNEFQPFDKAGAYGIQEWIGHAAVEKIEGSYFNVVGLPTHRLYEELMKF